MTDGKRMTTGRQVLYCLFTDPELARFGLNETEAQAQGIPYRLFKIPMEANLRARTLSETRGFLKALIAADSDRILGFTAFGVGAGEIMSAVQIAMIAELPFTALQDAVLTHPTLVEGLIPLFARWTILSSSAVTPSGLCRPLAFGMYTLRTGWARYAPRFSLSARSWRFVSNSLP